MVIGSPSPTRGSWTCFLMHSSEYLTSKTIGYLPGPNTNQPHLHQSFNNIKSTKIFPEYIWEVQGAALSRGAGLVGESNRRPSPSQGFGGRELSMVQKGLRGGHAVQLGSRRQRPWEHYEVLSIHGIKQMEYTKAKTKPHVSLFIYIHIYILTV